MALLAIVFILHAGVAVGFKVGCCHHYFSDWLFISYHFVLQFYYFNSALSPTNTIEPTPEVIWIHNSTQAQKHNQKGNQIPDLSPPSNIGNSILPPNAPNQDGISKSTPSANELPNRGSPPDTINNQGLTPPDVNIPINSRIQNPSRNSEVLPNQSKDEHLKSRETSTRDANSLTNSTASRGTLARNLQKNPARDVNDTTNIMGNTKSTSTLTKQTS